MLSDLGLMIYSIKYTGSTAEQRSPVSCIYHFQPRAKYNLLATKKANGNTMMDKKVWALNHKSKVPKFLEGRIIKQLGRNIFLILINRREVAYHRHQLRFNNAIHSELFKYRNTTLDSNSPTEDTPEIKYNTLHLTRRSERLRSAPFWTNDYYMHVHV